MRADPLPFRHDAAELGGVQSEVAAVAREHRRGGAVADLLDVDLLEAAELAPDPVEVPVVVMAPRTARKKRQVSGQ